MKITDEIKNKLLENLVYVRTYKLDKYAPHGYETDDTLEAVDQARHDTELLILNKSNNLGMRLDINVSLAAELFNDKAINKMIKSTMTNYFWADYNQWRGWMYDGLLRKLEKFCTTCNTGNELSILVRQDEKITKGAIKVIVDTIFPTKEEGDNGRQTENSGTAE